MNEYTFFTKLWSQAPLSWAIIRAKECQLLAQQKYRHPILEVGCGDGFVSQLIFNSKIGSIDIGLDLDTNELRRAQKRKIYRKLIQGDITKKLFKPSTFNTVFSNGVLEHIPDIEKALFQISHSMKSGGYFYTTSPLDMYSRMLFYHRMFKTLGLHSLADKYSKKINDVFKHIHLLSESNWKNKLKSAGFVVEKTVHYNHTNTIALHDIALPFASTAKIFKPLFDTLVLFPNVHKFIHKPLLPIFKSVFLQRNHGLEFASIFIVARKK